MKRINDLTHDELLQLDTDSFEQCVELEIAFAGITPFPEPEEPSIDKILVTPNNVFYKVHELLFKDKQDAVDLLEKEVFSTDYDYAIGSEFRYPVKKNSNPIEEVLLFNHKEIKKIAPDLKSNKIKSDLYDEQMERYNSYLSDKSTQRQICYDLLSEAKERERCIQNAVTSYEKYKTLAEGKETIAIGFFENAFKDESKEVKNIALSRCGVSGEAIEAVNKAIDEALKKKETDEDFN